MFNSCWDLTISLLRQDTLNTICTNLTQLINPHSKLNERTLHFPIYVTMYHHVKISKNVKSFSKLKHLFLGIIKFVYLISCKHPVKTKFELSLIHAFITLSARNRWSPHFHNVIPINLPLEISFSIKQTFMTHLIKFNPLSSQN
jgi:hypothetical protein